MNAHAYRAVLWDIDEQKFDELPQAFVIRRVLTHGTLGLIIEMIKSTGLDAVKEVFTTTKPTAMSARKHSYLKNYLLA